VFNYLQGAPSHQKRSEKESCERRPAGQNSGVS
jgi:hypothetical protein